MSGIKVLVVIYNKRLSDSAAINSICGMDGIEIYIADNSMRDLGNAEFALKHGYHYFDMGGNMGLSRAYNRVISALEKNNDIICLFDDDTTIDERYFDVLRENAEKYKEIDIFAPVVRDRKGILSPCIFLGVKGKRVKSLGQIPQHGVSVINSGLAIRLRVFRDYRYDEGQFLDYIDHAFIRDVTNQDKSRIRIMDVVLEQYFTGSGKSSKEEDNIRYKIFKKDVQHFCRKNGISSVSCSIFLLKRKIAIIIRHIFKGSIRGE